MKTGFRGWWLFGVVVSSAVLAVLGPASIAGSQGPKAGPVADPPTIEVDRAGSVEMFVTEGLDVRWKVDSYEFSYDIQSEFYNVVNLIAWTEARQISFPLDATRADYIPPGPERGSYSNVLTIDVDGQLSQLSYPGLYSRVFESLVSSLPLAVDDASSTVEGVPVVIDVMANDIWEEQTYPGNQPTPGVPSRPADGIGTGYGRLPRYGSVEVNPDGTVTYSAITGFFGTETFTYFLPGPDPSGDPIPESWAEVTVTVNQTSPRQVSFVGGLTTVSRDTPFVERLESDGYEVTRYDDDTVTPADVAGTIVVISSSVLPSTARPFAMAIDEPVVTWEPYVAEQLGLASDQRYANERDYSGAVTMVGSTHPVTSGVIDRDGRLVGPLVTGGTRWSRVTFDGWLLDTTRSLIWLADPSTDAFVIVDEDAKRVLLPWTYQTQGSLTDEGWQLFDQAVRWAVLPTPPS